MDISLTSSPPSPKVANVHASRQPTSTPSLARWLTVMSLTVAGFTLAPISTAQAAVCYQLPFPNPTLNDGWGSTCCGRTSPHRGVDFPQASGTPIPAVAAGTVVINTYSKCLGNVVVVQHGDGMFSGYNHMVVPSPLGPGTAVNMGDQVGQVGKTGTCANGAHLHLTMSDHADGYGSGTTVDPYVYITTHTICNDPPTGALDSADCSGIVGWAQDPNTPDTALQAHVYFNGPAGDPAAASVAIGAGIQRDDLCMQLGSCGHGFRMPVPLSLLDNVPHDVRAYAIDSEGGTNPELASMKTVTCGPPTLAGMRRHITAPEVMTAWSFSALTDLLTVDDATLASFPDTLDLSPVPLLVRSDDGTPDIWLLDGPEGERRRLVPDTDVAAAWHLNLATVVTWPAAQLHALDEAPPMRPRPIVVKGSGPDTYLLDDPLDPLGAGSDSGPPHDGSGTGGSGGHDSGDTPTTSPGADTSPGATTSGDVTASSGDSSSGAGEADDAGCGCRGTGDSNTAWLGAAVLLLAGVRPRRRAR